MRRYALITAGQQVVSTIRAARVQAVGKNRVLQGAIQFSGGRPVPGRSTRRTLRWGRCRR